MAFDAAQPGSGRCLSKCLSFMRAFSQRRFDAINIALLVLNIDF